MEFSGISEVCVGSAWLQVYSDKNDLKSYFC